MDGRTYLAWPFEQASTHFGVLLIAQYQLGHCMKIPKNHPTIKTIPLMRKNAAEFLRNPGLFSEARSKQAPAIKDKIPIVKATNQVTPIEQQFSRAELMD